MEMLRRGRREPGRPGGLRTRLLILFLIPVMLLGLAGLLVLPASQGALPPGAPGPSTSPLFALFFLVALLIATGLALHAGDRLARPVTWLLRLMDAGDSSSLRPSEQPPGDWEMEVLCRKVQVLLKQNLSGARAVEELDILRSEISGVLDAAGEGRSGGRKWTCESATHPLTRRLLDYFRTRADSVRESGDGLTRLQGLLEQDWRDETLLVEELAKRSERCFLEQTELAMELQRLARGSRQERAGVSSQEDPLTVLADLRVGIQHWRQEAQAALEGAAAAKGAAGSTESGALGVRRRFSEWTRWVDESLNLLERAVDGSEERDPTSVRRLVPRLKQVAETASQAGQELGQLSREAAQLERTWQRLGERLRSLMARIGETQVGAAGPVPLGEGGTGRDRAE